MSRTQRVDQRAELAEVRDEAAEPEEHRGSYMERMVLGSTPAVQVDADGALSYTTETQTQGES